MGNGLANRCRPPMKIHNLHGKYLRISPDKLLATRYDGYADALFFGSRTVDRDEQIELTITQMVSNWNGSLRFGFTSINPVDICNHEEGIPRFMCPDLIKRGGSFIETLNHIQLRVGDRIVFWVTNAGEIKVKVNEVPQRPQVTKLITRDVWPAVDVYGNAVEVKFRSLKDKIRSTSATEPHIYTLLNLTKFPLVANSDSIEIINRVSVKRKTVNKAFVWNANPLLVNTVWGLFVKDVDYLMSKDLSITVLTMEPEGLFGGYPDTLEGFTRGNVFKNIYLRMIQGDELAICILDNGSVMTALNGQPFESIGSVPKSVHYWIVTSLDCDISSLQSLGVYQMTKYSLPKLPAITENFASRLPSLTSEMSLGDSNHVTPVISIAIPEVTCDIDLPPNSDAECVICLNSVPDSVFIPCGHICCCKLCADNLMNEHGNLFCPTCRNRIESNIKVNF